ncbi:hypothetical protein [Corallincola spongiicola]|uniref:Uncharacterized protein n=1 Tax=Corallincola spongiicola TaxID=2520508 RepID=A0ABY1WU82_9GAMM|nr:hypothetical protein [Corallincola spongiicola]TAA48295.1 hypothetical protein EXY25_03420 [Corallincola spongiicola]
MQGRTNTLLGIFMSEEKLSGWIVRATCGSYLAFGLLVVVIYTVVTIGESRSFSPFAVKALVISLLYIVSVYLVATLPSKSVKRRLWSWGYSAAFHTSLLVYFSLAANLGAFVLLLLLAEVVIASLVLLGLYQVMKVVRHSRNA